MKMHMNKKFSIKSWHLFTFMSHFRISMTIQPRVYRPITFPWNGAFNIDWGADIVSKDRQSTFEHSNFLEQTSILTRFWERRRVVELSEWILRFITFPMAALQSSKANLWSCPSIDHNHVDKIKISLARLKHPGMGICTDIMTLAALHESKKGAKNQDDRVTKRMTPVPDASWR